MSVFVDIDISMGFVETLICPTAGAAAIETAISAARIVRTIRMRRNYQTI